MRAGQALWSLLLGYVHIWEAYRAYVLVAELELQKQSKPHITLRKNRREGNEEDQQKKKKKRTWSSQLCLTFRVLIHLSRAMEPLPHFLPYWQDLMWSSIIQPLPIRPNLDCSSEMWTLLQITLWKGKPRSRHPARQMQQRQWVRDASEH